ncbi:MAG: hypothetical protein HYT13_02360 [Candidatus Liptonbacteria bacterium]|nr:hypothetical protein [Candidatus Liptonbacteria bacterium]
MSRRARQVIYISSYLAVFLFISFFVYLIFFKTEASCFDKVKNQGERGVDCGGPCLQVCRSEVKPIEILEEGRILRPDESHLSLLSRARNPNLDYAARSFIYTFSLYNEEGSLIQNFSGESFIYAGEVDRYILLANLNLPNKEVYRASIKIQDEKWVKAEDFPRPKVNIQYHETVLSSDGIEVQGRVVNLDTVVLPSLKIIGLFYGKFGQIAGASQSEVENLLPNESRAFSINHPPVLNINPRATRIFFFSRR